jgi:hypothetical protein
MSSAWTSSSSAARRWMRSSSEFRTGVLAGMRRQAQAELARLRADLGEPAGEPLRLVAELRQVGVARVGRRGRRHPVEADVVVVEVGEDRLEVVERDAQAGLGLVAARVVGGESARAEHLDGEAETHAPGTHPHAPRQALLDGRRRRPAHRRRRLAGARSPCARGGRGGRRLLGAARRRSRPAPRCPTAARDPRLGHPPIAGRGLLVDHHAPEAGPRARRSAPRRTRVRPGPEPDRAAHAPPRPRGAGVAGGGRRGSATSATPGWAAEMRRAAGRRTRSRSSSRWSTRRGGCPTGRCARRSRCSSSTTTRARR